MRAADMNGGNDPSESQVPPFRVHASGHTTDDRKKQGQMKARRMLGYRIVCISQLHPAEGELYGRLRQKRTDLS